MLEEMLCIYQDKTSLSITKTERNFLKHLSIISFKPKALIKYAKIKRTSLEESENIELIRALEIGLKIKTENLTETVFP